MPASPYPRSIVDILAAAGERPVFEHGDRTVSGAGLLDTIRRVSAGLRSAGVGPGVGVAMVLGVSPEAFAAAQVVGARVAGVRPSLTPHQLRHVLDQDISAVVVDSPAALLRVRAAAPADARLLAVGPVAGLPDLLIGPLHVRGPDEQFRSGQRVLGDSLSWEQVELRRLARSASGGP